MRRNPTRDFGQVGVRKLLAYMLRFRITIGLDVLYHFLWTSFLCLTVEMNSKTSPADNTGRDTSIASRARCFWPTADHRGREHLDLGAGGASMRRNTTRDFR